MCGIYCSVLITNTKHKQSTNSINNIVRKNLTKRGPDANHLICENNILFAGFVLWQQGSALCPQPATNSSIILLFNGDAFNSVQSKEYEEIGDTLWILNEITKCQTDMELCNFFKTLEGPFSIIFYNKETKSLYFARDSLGRNSLIIERDEQHLRISSTTCFSKENASNAIELPPLGLFKINISDLQLVTLYPWLTTSVQSQNVDVLKSTIDLPVRISNQIAPIWLCKDNSNTNECDDFYKLLNESHNTMQTNALFHAFLREEWVAENLKIFSHLLENSVRDRVTRTPKYCINCIASASVAKCNHSKIGILFSGGIDCTILAVLANNYVDTKDSIDLINVAFEPVKMASTNTWQVPDRCSAQLSFRNLQLLCPERTWNFIEVNVTRKELEYSMRDHIKNLIYPLNTILDESIGAAFWFASRGIGFCNGRLRRSCVRVIIVGSGADELFGGYARHRTAYNRCSGSHEEKQMQVLLELQKDWERIPARNLGRDDRVIADNGKTSRAPFIEESIVQFVQARNPSQLCCFQLKEGVGDKLLLRLYGYTLGIDYAVQLKKRAIQFGSRIANKNENAANISKFLC